MTNKNSKAAFTAKEISIIAIFTAITVALSQISLPSAIFTGAYIIWFSRCIYNGNHVKAETCNICSSVLLAAGSCGGSGIQ